jgi:AcrR family transcriptional regulator
VSSFPSALPIVPRQKRALESREALFQAALDQFAKKGVGETTVEEICAATGASRGTFFRYFPRKEDVLLEAGVRRLRTRAAVLAPRAPEMPAREAVAAWLEAIVAGDSAPYLDGAILLEVMRSQPRFAAMLGDPAETMVMRVAGALTLGQQRGEVRDDVDAFTLGATLTAGVTFPLALTGFPQDPHAPSDPSLPGRLLRRSVDLLWPSMQAGAPPVTPLDTTPSPRLPPA